MLMEPIALEMASKYCRDAVVKVYFQKSCPNYLFPWKTEPPREDTGSGFAISERRILTNAHVVAYQTFVQVCKHGSTTKYKAEVQAVGNECDLALLTVSEEEFWEGMNFLEFGKLPYLGESVAVLGYRQGSDCISVTTGFVSRIEPSQYIHGAANLMAIETDAAINPGDCGGPVIMNDKVAGVVSQRLTDVDNIGYIIPVPIIEHFMADVNEHGKYIGFCTFGVSWQKTENIHLRNHLKMPPELTGVLVNKIYPLCHSHVMLKKDDVITAFDDVPIANDGTVQFRNKERICFEHLVSMKKAGETGAVRVLRDGVQHEFHIKLGPYQSLFPVDQFDKLPSYFSFGGFVFTPLTQAYLRAYRDYQKNTNLDRFHHLALTQSPQKSGEQIIILSQDLMDDINTGYKQLSGLQVKKVEGVKVDNLEHLRQLVEGKTESLCFELDYGKLIVLSNESAKR